MRRWSRPKARICLTESEEGKMLKMILMIVYLYMKSINKIGSSKMKESKWFWFDLRHNIANWLFRVYWKMGLSMFDECRDIEMDYFKFYNTGDRK